MVTNKDDLIARLENARSRLNTALEKLAPQAEIYPSWKVKQLLDHITGWDELVAASFRNYAEGELPDMTVKNGIDQFNAVSVDDRKALTLEQSWQAFGAAREAVFQAIMAMPPGSLDRRYKAPWGGFCTIASVVKILASHEVEHAEKIEALLGSTA